MISVDMVQYPETVKRLSVFSNVELWTYDTRNPALKEALEKEGQVDFLFIDTEHTNAQVTAEFESLHGLVRKGGIVVFDDIRINGVDRFWNQLQSPKLELNHLHWSGFGLTAL